MRSLRCKLLIGFVLLVFAGLAAAQDQYQYSDQYSDQPSDQYSDPPTRVARLQFIAGQVSLQPGGVDDWIDAGLNRPLTTADRLWVDHDSRTELSIGSAALRLGGESSLSVTNLNDNTAQFELDQGVLNLSVRYLNPGDIVEVDTPNLAFTATQPGDYRIDVRPENDETSIQVRRGDGEVSGQEASMEVPAGQRYVFYNGTSLQYDVAELTPPSRFDNWCDRREYQEENSVSARYVAPGTIGYSSLDGNGDWAPSPVYGNVWFPRVHAGWAPYREGHWDWVEPWGWTWVDDEPWGFAPFHYGRWVVVDNRWGWVPGPREVHPVYAPALVAWIGGPSFGVSIGIGGGGGVGWVPLGWRDPYIPSYHVSPEYARRVNISNTRVVNTTIINNYYSTTNVNVRNETITKIRYENVSYRGAVTAVPANALASGRPVSKFAVAVPPQAVAHMTFARAATVAPTRQAVLGGHPPAAAPAKLVVPKTVVARTPPPPPPVSFAKQQPLLQKSGGMPVAPAQRANLRATTPVPAVRPGRPAVVTATKAPAKPPSAMPPSKFGARPAAPFAGRPAPGAPPAARETTPGARPAPPSAAPGERTTPFGRPAAPAAERPTAPAFGRPAEPPSAERPAPAFGRPAAPEGERPAPSARPGTPGERPAAPAFGRPAAPEGERPAPSARPGTPPAAQPGERSFGRPAAPSERPAPSARPGTPPAAQPGERSFGRPAAPPSREAAPGQEKRTPPQKENQKKNENNPNER